jgi:hypothetical protein
MKEQYKEAKRIVTKAVKTRERIAGQDDLSTLTSVSILATVYQYQGQYEAAVEMN